MNKYHNLLSSISQELNVLNGSAESVDNWKARVVYSAIGQMALASLYDVQEENCPISIIHFKRRIEDLYNSYLRMYPELRPIFGVPADTLSDLVYGIYLKTGHIYHSPHRITASIQRKALGNQIVFIRGAALNQKVFRSGLGAYLTSCDKANCITTTELFGLHDMSLSDYWNKTISNAQWSSLSFATKTEYLITSPPFNKGYFKVQPDKDGRISILRTGMPGSYLYFLYTFRNGEMLGMQIDSLKADNFEYRMLANSCIYSKGDLPPALYHVDREIVTLKLQYLYPPSEQNMIQLYAWPIRYDLDNSFQFILSLPVFLAIKSELERLGYSFVEE